MKEKDEDPSFIIGPEVGPYVAEQSRSIFCKLGARIGFLGIDARMERTRHQINYRETYDLIFNRLDYEYNQDPNLKHLILLLGVPIAYPRLQWLENIFASPIIAPFRLLNRHFGFGGGFFNKFDGAVDLLDDLDDHYTTKHHKSERRRLVQDLQNFSQAHNVRVTILGGDVHLAAVGSFYSKPRLGLRPEHDWRYMVNVISSAITNKPPPAAVANLIAGRDKVHHLDADTNERMLPVFDHDPGRSPAALQMHRREPARSPRPPARKTAARNRVTMPSRNYAILCESGPAAGRRPRPPPPSSSSGSAPPAGDDDAEPGAAAADGEPRRGGGGSAHPAADGLTPSGLGGEHGLDVTLRVEIDPGDPDGVTYGYGLTVPGLDVLADADKGGKGA
jgi:hypothetical protein